MSKSIPDVRAVTVTEERAFWEHASLRELGVIVFCLGVALAATFPHSPAFMPYVMPDSGTFQYVGHRLLEGQVLYVDVWDQKPPLIYFINALGVWLGGGGRWGVWLLSFGAVLATAALSVQLLRRVFGLAIAMVVTALWLLAYFQLIDDGNMTEEFALPLQFGVLWLAYRVETEHEGKYGWRGFLIGILVGLIFFLKSNVIGIGLAVGIYVLIKACVRRDVRYALAQLVPMIGGSVLVAVVVLAVLWVQGALSDFFVIVFQYNLIYTERFGLIEGTLTALRAGFENLSVTGLAAYGGLGYVLGLVMFFAARRNIPAKMLPLLGICAIALPLEVALVTTTRRGFMHYYVALFYVLAVWAGWLFWLVRQALYGMMAPMSAQKRNAVTFGLVCGVVILALPAIDHNVTYARELRALQPPEVVEYIREQTTPEDTVLILGYEPRLLLFGERRSPTRFMHTIPFEFPRFATPELVESYFDDILTHKPALIVDPRGYGLNNFTPADSRRIQRQVNQLREQYAEVGPIGGWMVYRRNERAN